MPPSADLCDLALELVRATELAALAASRWVGRGDEDGAAAEAAAAAHGVLGSIALSGTVVTGGSRGGAFAAGEPVGDGSGPACDVAVSPCDGPISATDGAALSVVAVSAPGRMFAASRGVEMDTLVVGPAAGDAVDIDRPAAQNVRAVAAATQRPISEVTVAVLDPARQERTVRAVRATGARVRAVTGGEVAVALATSHPAGDLDLLVGVGGAHEAVLAAAALACVGGSIQARLRPRDAGQRRRALDAGHDLDAVLRTRDLVGDEGILFGATGITDGDDVPGVQYRAGLATTYSVAMCSEAGAVRVVEGAHQVDRLHDVLGV